MSITDKIMELVKNEIALDPEGRGYAGKTDDEIQKLLNDAYAKSTVVETQMTPRISAILAGIPNTENTISKEEVISAKAFTPQ